MVTRVMSGLSTTTKEKTAIGLLVFFALIFAQPADLYAAAEILGSWTEGTSHTAESGSRRALIFTAHAEDEDSDMNITSVTYGGQSMTKVIEQNHGTPFRLKLDFNNLLNLICQERGWFVSNGRYNANKYI